MTKSFWCGKKELNYKLSECCNPISTVTEFLDYLR